MIDLDKYITDKVTRIKGAFKVRFPNADRGWLIQGPNAPKINLTDALSDIVNNVIADFTPPKPDNTMPLKYSAAYQEWLYGMSLFDLNILLTDASIVRSLRTSRKGDDCIHGKTFNCKECAAPIVDTLNKERIKNYLEASKKFAEGKLSHSPELKLFEK